MLWRTITIVIVTSACGQPTKPPPTARASPTPKASDGPVSEGKVSEGKVSVHDKAAYDESTLTPDAVLGEVQSAYLTGIKRCYKDYLKQDADARGKVKLSFTVTESGSITNGKAAGFAAFVDDCVTQQMTAWKFPIPMDRDGTATTAAFAITLQLIPE